MTKTKATIILGAGFSKLAEFPLQNDILSRLDDFYQRETITAESEKNWRQVVEYFNLNIGIDISTYLIEDLFTILDKCISDEEYFKYSNIREIEHVKISLITALRDFFNQITKEKIENMNDYSKYVDLANVILDQRQRNKSEDKLSIISLNWDCFFERILQYYSVNYEKIALDYCTYDYSFNNKKTTPSILKKTKGYKNLKILKAHGSTNWGYCPNCKRLYISFGNKMNSKSGETLRKYECIKYCNKIYSKSINLIPVLITPTFLKDMGNYHLKNIWSNIGIELQEANKVIIIGYSLRPEDFYFRFVLSKYIRPDTEVYVFDYTNASVGERNEYKEHLWKRYRHFLQKNKVEVFIEGWEKNINKIERIIDI